jgi:hypothetical protein
MEILLGTLAYIVPTFPLAYFWHLKLFKARYEKWEYFVAPSPMLGLLSMVVQGLVLAYLYFHAVGEAHDWRETFAFVGIWGLFHWSLHVLAAMAKHADSRNWGFFALESVFVAIQFGCFGASIGCLASCLHP